ncbi:hypothetical protein FACS1894120_3150 [Clostridia bacterium]|nr:hypothetical protein FACS1894120_3150 [Clostridia bacterium]
MILAGLKKEAVFFLRRRLIVVLVLLFLMAVINPVLYKTFADTVSLAQAQGMDISQFTPLYEQLGGNLPLTAVVSSFSTIYSFGLIAFFIAIMPMAGGERSKRAEIIPRMSGLTHEGFVIPKFIFYVILSFVISAAACSLSVKAATSMSGDRYVTGSYATDSANSDGVYDDIGAGADDSAADSSGGSENDSSADSSGGGSKFFRAGNSEQLRYLSNTAGSAVQVSGIDTKAGYQAALLVGLFFAFCTALYLFVGITTGRPGLSVILTLIGVEAVSFLLEKISGNGYNPTALAEIGTALIVRSSGGGVDMGLIEKVYDPAVSAGLTPANIAASVLSSVILIVVLLLLTILLRRAHEVDNSAD